MADYFTLLRDRVTLKCRSIDRIFLQAYVPKLQTVGQVCTFLRWQRRFPIPSSAAFGKIGGCLCRSHLLLCQGAPPECCEPVASHLVKVDWNRRLVDQPRLCA